MRNIIEYILEHIMEIFNYISYLREERFVRRKYDKLYFLTIRLYQRYKKHMKLYFSDDYKENRSIILENEKNLKEQAKILINTACLLEWYADDDMTEETKQSLEELKNMLEEISHANE